MTRMSTRPLLVVLLVAAVALPVGAVTGAPTVSQDAARQSTLQVQTQENASENASFGIAVASFAQASAAEAQGEVGQEMFEARFNRSNASERADVVHERVDELQATLETLRERRADLLSDDNVTIADRAEAARLTARIDALQRSINGTEVAAERAGLNVTALDILRNEASTLTGPEIAAIATGLIDAGPPDDRGPPEDGEAGPSDGNETDANGTDGTGSDGGADGRDGNQSSGGTNESDAGANETDADQYSI